MSDGLTGSPPPPFAKLDDDDTDSTTTADSDLEQALVNTRRNSGSLPTPATSFGAQAGSKAPFNPFARTLETSEAQFGLRRKQEDQTEHGEVDVSDPATPRARKLDVDAFKNILMGGAAVPTQSFAVQQQSQQRPQDSSSTDTSSISAQSIFDPMQEAHPESPRTSFDDHHSDSDSAVDDESSSLMGPVASRPVEEGPPRPPKPMDQRISRAFPQTVSFADFDGFTPSSIAPPAPSTPPINTPLQAVIRPVTPRSQSDLNKPLPPPPAEQGLSLPSTILPSGSDISSQQPSTASAMTSALSQSKKTPPPPPTSRRQNQTGGSEGRDRSISNLSQSSIQSNQHYESDAVGRLTDQSPKPAPPPPPSRRSQPAFSASSPAEGNLSERPASFASLESKVMPPPPPRRQPGKSGTSINRTPSDASHKSLPRSNSLTTVAATGPAPPAPPPRRGAASKRDSMETGPPNSMSTRRSSGNEYRRTSGQSFDSERSISITSLSLKQVDEPGEPEEGPMPSEHGPATKGPSQNDILADMTAFQAEIDALRAQSSKRV